MPLPENSTNKEPALEWSIARDKEGEGEDSHSMRELIEEIESHIEVIDLDNLNPNTAPNGTSASKPNLSPTNPLIKGITLP